MIVPCPIFKWERECENCGATIEVYYPPDVAFEFKLGNVKEICVEREKGLEFVHKAIVLDNQCLVIANVFPLCNSELIGGILSGSASHNFSMSRKAQKIRDEIIRRLRKHSITRNKGKVDYSNKKLINCPK